MSDKEIMDAAKAEQAEYEKLLTRFMHVSSEQLDLLEMVLDKVESKERTPDSVEMAVTIYKAIASIEQMAALNATQALTMARATMVSTGLRQLLAGAGGHGRAASTDRENDAQEFLRMAREKLVGRGVGRDARSQRTDEEPGDDTEV